jgi:hypothetical protein
MIDEEFTTPLQQAHELISRLTDYVESESKLTYLEAEEKRKLNRAFLRLEQILRDIDRTGYRFLHPDSDKGVL